MIANFSATPQRVDFEELPTTWISGRYHDHVAGTTVDFSHGGHIVLPGYECLWLGHPQNGPGNHTVAVELSLRVETQPGEMIYLSGNIPQLGEWNPDRAFGPLDPADYPVWKGRFRAAPGTVFEFVWVKKRDREVVASEPGFRVYRVDGNEYS